jgi:hypothetical protein
MKALFFGFLSGQLVYTQFQVFVKSISQPPLFLLYDPITYPKVGSMKSPIIVNDVLAHVTPFQNIREALNNHCRINAMLAGNLFSLFTQ